VSTKERLWLCKVHFHGERFYYGCVDRWNSLWVSCHWYLSLGLVVHPTTQEAEAGGFQAQGQPGLPTEAQSQKASQCGDACYNPTNWGGRDRRITVSGQPGQTVLKDCILKSELDVAVYPVALPLRNRRWEDHVSRSALGKSMRPYLKLKGFLFLFLVAVGFELRAYTLSHSTSPFCVRYFWDWVSRTVCPG
jgi:hypothetical protein